MLDIDRPVSKLDKAIVARRSAQYNLQDGPRIGDFLKMPNGVYQRLTNKLKTHFQAGASTDQLGFYLGEGYISFSGALNAGVKCTDLLLSDETKIGFVWIFHDGVVKEDNSVILEMEFRVFTLREGADVTGLWDVYNHSSY